MKISVKVKPNSKIRKIEKLDEKNFVVFVNCPPVENKANKAMLEMLSEYFQLPRSELKIVSGHKSKNKVVEIPE